MIPELPTEKLYYRDPGQSEFEARILEVRKTGKWWEVILDKTCFYPEGGGQPADKGLINEVPVLDVRKSGETVIHVLPENPGEGAVKGKIDMNWRRDFMQQHTGQHIISAALWQIKGYKTVSVHMGADYTTIEIDAPDISDETLFKGETLANEIIMRDLPVHFIQANSEELERYNLRKPCPVEERIRLVKIGDFDCVGCGGLHFERTGMVGLVKAVAREKIRGNTRITWMIGRRAFEDYRNKHEIVVDLKSLLETEMEILVRKTADLKNELGISQKKNNLLTNQLADILSRNLYERSLLPTGSGFRVITESWQDADDRLIKKIMKNLINRENVIACLLNIGFEKVQWSIGCSQGIDFPFENFKAKLMAVIDGKGGGRFPLWQGTGSKPGQSDEFLMVFVKLVEWI
jgi:alanyl-tRNA synthetase